jgi:glycosyltransferase involved in cell wall biosynthesis/MoaA/NifB/PqqE/SkfB family radical SAM enzyme
MPTTQDSGFSLHQPGRLSRGAVLDVGLKCVHSCRFCYYSYLDKSDDQFRGMRRAEFRTLEECKEIVRRLKDNGFVNFDVTGGEPTLHQGIIEIMRYAHQDLGLKGRIITLGQYLMRRMKNGKHERLIDDLLEAGLTNFLFSMHAVDEVLFEKLTGESWEKQRCAMDYLDEKGFQFTGNTTVVEWNYRNLPDIAREILKHGIYLHNFIIMNAYYAWNKDGKAFGVQAKYSEIHPYLREAVEILESNDVGVNIRYAPLCAVKGMEKNLVGMLGVRYDPYEWMNAAGHFGGTPEQCAAVLAVPEGGIEAHLQYRDVNGMHENGVRVSGMRGQNLKHFADKCVSCAAKPVCDGIDPNYLRNHGPDEFVPYADLQREPLHKDRYTYLMPFLVKTGQYADMKSVVKEAFAAWRKMKQSIPPRPTPTVAASPRADARPKVSVVVTCYNYGRYLKEAVGSVLAQTWRDFEVVIVDDGSTDNSREVIEQIIGANPSARIRAIHQPNSGQPAHSRNRGIREARGEYVLCLDADDMIPPTMLERCVSVLEANPQVAIAYTDRLDFDGVEQLVKAAPYDAKRLPYQNHLSYCALYRRKVWEDVGGYRDNVKGCEDWDFWVAACAAGHYGQYIPEPLFLYRRHDTGLYQHALANFDQKRAQIVLNNRSLYRPEDIGWAEGLLGTPAAAPAAESVATAQEPAGRPLVSVIVPTANRPGFLKDALASLVAQDYPNWETIVVNDGGRSVEALAVAADPVGRVRVIELRGRCGPAIARNTALRVARGEIICYLDDDDLFLPNHLSTVVRALAQPGADFAYTEAEVVVESLTEGTRKVVGRSSPYRQPGYSRDTLLVSNYIPINTWAHRWSCLERAGFFDESLPALEDWELLLRLARHTDFRHAPTVTAEVRHRQDRGDSRTGHARLRMVDTYREIYARTDDVANTAVKREREKVLAFLSQSLGLAPAPTSGTAAQPAMPMAAPSPAKPTVEKGADYREWTNKHALKEIDAEVHAERMLLHWKQRPLVHLIVQDRRGDEAALARTLESLGEQLYKQWRLTVMSRRPAPTGFPQDRAELKWLQIGSNADIPAELNRAAVETAADWVGLIEAGDTVEANLLLSLGDYINLRPEWRLVYTDEDVLATSGERHSPRLKPDFNLDLLRSQAYIGNFCVVRRDALIAAGGFGAQGIEHYDLALRVLDQFGETAIGHVAAVLGHRAADNEGSSDGTARERLGKAALNAHLERRGIKAVVGDGLLPGTFRVMYWHDARPRVSVLIATRDHVNALATTVEALLERTDYDNLEVVIADVGSGAEDTFDYYRKLETSYPDRVRIHRGSDIAGLAEGVGVGGVLNDAAAGTQGEYLLLLAPGAVPLQPEWLDRLLAHGQRPEIAIVGARLTRWDQRMQHGGIVLGLGTNGVAGHLHAGLPLTEPGYLGRAQLDQDLSAVSEGCLLIRKSVFDEVAGLDAQTFPLILSGLDLCLRVGARGHKIVWTPHVTLACEETQPLAAALGEEERTRRFKAERERLLERWLPRLARDPAWNPNLSLQLSSPTIEDRIDAPWDTSFHERPHVLAVPLDRLGVGHHRAIAPLRALEQSGRAHIAFTPCSDMQANPRMPSVTELARLAPDALYLQSTLHDVHIEHLKQYRRFNRVFKVFDFEDLKTNVPEKNSRKSILFPEVKRRLREALASCDRMTVTTVPLAEAYRHLIGDIRVLPLRLARSTWGSLVSKRRQGRKPRVGWAGAQQHHADLEVLIPVVKETAQDIDWVFFGMCLDELKPYVKEVHGFVPFEQYPQKLASLNLDLAVAPLELHAFNEAKTNLRLLEFGAMGWPVVCTDIYPYQNAPVQRVPNDPQAWLEAICARVHDLDAAASEGDRLRAWVFANYMLEDHLDEWLAALSPSAAKESPSKVAASS